MADRSRRRPTFAEGDHVSWQTPQGRTRGRIVERVTGTAQVDGHTAKASEDEPQYRVRSDATGAEAIHRPEALRKLRDKR